MPTTIRDNRDEMRSRAKEVCRVCGSTEVHNREYGQPTIKCIGYLRDRWNAEREENVRLNAELAAYREMLEAINYVEGEIDSREFAFDKGPDGMWEGHKMLVGERFASLPEGG